MTNILFLTKGWELYSFIKSETNKNVRENNLKECQELVSEADKIKLEKYKSDSLLSVDLETFKTLENEYKESIIKKIMDTSCEATKTLCTKCGVNNLNSLELQKLDERSKILACNKMRANLIVEYMCSEKNKSNGFYLFLWKAFYKNSFFTVTELNLEPEKPSLPSLVK